MKIIFLFLLISSSAFAEISDPHGILNQADEFLGHVPFETAYQVGDQITFAFQECTGTCDPSVPLSKAVVEKSDAGLKINQYGASGSWYSSEAISASAWDAAHRSYLRGRVNGIASFGFRVEVRRSELVRCPEPFEGQECMKVEVVGRNALGMTTEVDYVVRPSESALGQILHDQQRDAGLVRRNISFSVRSLSR